MRVKGIPPRVGDIARELAGAPILIRRGARPVLLSGYLESVEQCARANDCAWCQHAVEARRRRSSCRECGREPWRRWCSAIGPCDVGVMEVGRG